MLKDKLMKISTEHSHKNLCSLGQELAAMDEETLGAFTEAMKSGVSSLVILDILREESMGKFGISHLREKRRTCFQTDKTCRCMEAINNAR